MTEKDVMGMLMIVTKGFEDIKKDHDLIKKCIDNLKNYTKILINEKGKDKNSNTDQTIDKQQSIENVTNDDTNKDKINNNPVNDQDAINTRNINILHQGNYMDQGQNNDNNRRRTRVNDDSIREGPYSTGQRLFKRPNISFGQNYNRFNNNQCYNNNVNN